MSKRSSKPLVEAMLEAIGDIMEFWFGHSQQTFIESKMTRTAVLKMLEVIGESANRLPAELKARYPEIEWEKIIRSRNIIIHDYEIINYDVIWRIVTVHLPPLQGVLNKNFR